MLRIKEAVEFANIKIVSNNLLAGKPKDEGKITISSIAGQIWPNYSESSLRRGGSRLLNGNMKGIRPEWVLIICRETGVDANFLFGLPSQHDSEYYQTVLMF